MRVHPRKEFGPDALGRFWLYTARVWDYHLVPTLLAAEKKSHVQL